jgi:hypothetical protein
MSLVGWFLHDILMSWYTNNEIGLSSSLFPTIFVTIGLYLQTFINIRFFFSPKRVFRLNSLYHDLSLQEFTILKLMND